MAEPRARVRGVPSDCEHVLEIALQDTFYRSSTLQDAPGQLLIRCGIAVEHHQGITDEFQQLLIQISNVSLLVVVRGVSP